MKGVNFQYIVRFLKRRKVYSLVSIAGLVISSACALLIGTYILFQTSFNKFFDDTDRIYRVTANLGKDEVDETGLCSFDLGPKLKESFADIESYTRILSVGKSPLLKVEDQELLNQRVLMVDSTFFDVFSFNLINGNPDTWLRNSREMILTERLASKLFGSEDPIGKQVKLDGKDAVVVGLVQDVPQNSDVKFDALISLRSLPAPAFQTFTQDWLRLLSQMYVKTSVPVDHNQWQTMLKQMEEKHARPWLEANGVDNNLTYSAQLLTDIHLDISKVHDLPKGNPVYLTVFGLVAFLLLVTALINFVNLTLAQQITRVKELGVRKMVGASSSQIRAQFFSESLVIIGISFFLALVCAELFIPVFETYATFEIQTSWFLQPRYLIWIVMLFLFITAVGALYPAFYLSRLPVAQVLSPKSHRNHRIGWFRKALIVLQFAFAVFMLIATVTVHRQLDFIQSYDTGIETEKLLTFQLPRDTTILNRLPFLRDQMEKIPEVSSASFSGTLPSLGQGELLFRIEQDGMLGDMAVKEMFVDESFLETMGVEMVKGRNFDRGRPSDASKAFLINESGARHFGWDVETALGKRVQWGLYSDNKAANDGEIVGVYKDFNFESLHSEIEPLILIYSPKQGQLLTMRSPERLSAKNLANIRDQWASLTGSLPNDYFFLSDKIDENYKTELQMLEIFWIFSGFSIVIALLGVFAMSYFYAIEKTKEIGIRIVLGASLKDLALFLSRDITPLFVVASLLASAAAFWGLSYWLNSFAFHISLNGTYFIGAIALVATLLLTIILLQTIKTRGSQPIRALRFE